MKREDSNGFLEELLAGREAIIFDEDGTLIDSMWIWADIDIEYVARYGKTTDRELTKKLSGLSILQTADYFRDVIGINETTEKMLSDWNEMALDYYTHKIPLKEEAGRLLNDISSRGIPMAICTSNTRTLALTALEVHNIKGYFDIIITGEDVEKGKPDPFIYLEAARRLGVGPNNCLVFEDISAGALAGKRAGMEACGVFDESAAYMTADLKAIADYYAVSFKDIYDGTLEILNPGSRLAENLASGKSFK
ncbi:MAG: HAD family phosphatase [Lachnospiraceae bacterium]|nr:HAD family phosphatase [Lachnospiraceae bacterium]